MSSPIWLNGPVGMGSESRVLRVGCRRVLVVVPFVVTGTALFDVLPLLESDHRVLTVFTVAPAGNGATCHGAEDFLRSHGALVLPWHQAVQTEFDLVLAASPEGVAQLHGKLLLLPHGAGAVRPLLRARSAGAEAAPTHALDREALTSRGRVVPHAVALLHDSEVAVLHEACPEAAHTAVVAGDMCYDRLTASIPLRAVYRRALGVAEGRKLVVVTSTWQPESALGRNPELVDDLLRALPVDEYRVAAVLHPNIWSVHGAWQVRAWLADCLDAGLLLMPPEEGWRAALVAADLVVGDYGSVTRYAAAIGRPVLLAAFPEHQIRRGSAAEWLVRHAPHLDATAPLLEQVRAAQVHDIGWQEGFAQRMISRPGHAGAVLRETMYRLLDLAEPARGVPVSPVPLPEPITSTTTGGRHG